MSLFALTVVAVVAFALSAPQSSYAAAASSAAASSTQVKTAAMSSAQVTAAQAIQRVFDDTNAVRAQKGLPPFVRNAAIDRVAQAWAEQQWKNGAMSHNPSYSTQIPAGWSRAGENVAHNYTYDKVVAAWVASASHYANLVNDYTDEGIGYYVGSDGQIYWAVNFGTYATTKVPPAPSPSPTPTPTPTPTTTPKPTPTPTPTTTPKPSPTPTTTPKPTPTPTTAPAPPPAGSYPAEPAAPAGTAMPLKSPSFEGTSAGWSGGSLYGPNTLARGGKYSLNASGTVSQTVGATLTAGETYTSTVWVHVGSGSSVSGYLRLTALGGTTETATMSFSTSRSDWMKVSLPLKLARAGHNGLRFDVVLSGSGRLDSTSLVRTGNAPAAVAPAAAPAPTQSTSTAPSTATIAPAPAASKPAPTTAPAPAPAPAPPAPAPAPAPPAPAPAPAPPAPAPAPAPSGGGLGGLLGGLLGG